MGFTLTYLSLIVLIPLAALILKTTTITWGQFIQNVTNPRVMASYRLTFGASLVGAVINSFFGVIVAWVLVRYEFPGKKLMDALVDLPFALPTAVAGITLTAIYSTNGWIGSRLAPLGIHVAYTPLGIMVALTFIGLPFVVRQVQPMLIDFDREVEEAATTLGANPFQRFFQIMLPAIGPALISGVTLAFARAVGEYGSVIFIAGNTPFKSEIAPLLIVIKLEEFDYAGAAAIGLSMVVIAFGTLVVVNTLQVALARRGRS